MRSLDQTTARWRATQAHASHLDHLRKAVRDDAAESPCITGCRSICWKAFLLSKDDAGLTWPSTLRQARQSYQHHQDRLLKFIKHPEALAQVTVDPLADDPQSPWNTLREDEVIRTEIQQDVLRLPDEANYHEKRIQTMVIDILFIYCKLNPNRGGYRQGMHELLAPMVHVIEQDALDRHTLPEGHDAEDFMLEMLDCVFVEHDAYAMFARLMEHAQSFYDLKSSDTGNGPNAQRVIEQSSAIVERSQFIHEVCLHKVDPELATHLTIIEILPQIFLIRWIRLLFSREFPFEQCLVLWDTTFAIDQSLELIDLICVAMLLRIRWQLLEADYSVCLQLLLRYPPPDPDQGPSTFVDDAMYLRDHLDVAGGASLIEKYTGKPPRQAGKSSDGSRPSTPSFRPWNTLRQRGFATRSPLNSPPRINQGVGVEALFQGAAKGAKGVFERGERLGINQAVRDAMGEIRRNVQGFNDARLAPGLSKDILSDDPTMKALAAMETRNRQLASMLSETVSNLKIFSATNVDDKAKSLELIEVAAAKIQFVQIYLEDPTMELPEPASPDLPAEPNEETTGPDLVKQAEAAADVPVADADTADVASLSLAEQPGSQVVVVETGSPPNDATSNAEDAAADALSGPPAARPLRPGPIPTRSTLAQSSFSWMLEPEQPASAQSPPGSARSPPQPQFKKRGPNNASRERNAFLFGEVTGEGEGGGRLPLDSDEIFGLETIGKAKK